MVNLLQFVGIIAWWMSTWAILFTGRYPRGLFKLNVGVLRWYMGYYTYLFSLYDEFPPLDLDQRPNRELILEVDYPRTSSRLPQIRSSSARPCCTASIGLPAVRR